MLGCVFTIRESNMPGKNLAKAVKATEGVSREFHLKRMILHFIRMSFSPALVFIFSICRIISLGLKKFRKGGAAMNGSETYLCQ